MPKKHRNIYPGKPGGTAHPSLSTAKNGLSNKKDAAPYSVNDLLSNLRQANQSQNDRSRASLVQPPTMPPAVRQLLQLPDTPAPRPRIPRRTDANGHRLPAGPAPPSSWLTPSRSVSGPWRSQERQERIHPETVMHLPWLGMNAPHGLVHLCLKKLATDWEFQSHYNTYYLASMPTRLRVLLLSYIAVYGPDEGVGVDGLSNIIRPPPGANTEDHYTGNDNFQRLDVSCAVGRSISFPQLSEIIFPHEEVSEDSWYLDTPSTLRSNPTTFLPFLTHLSISHPPSNISWPKLLKFAKNVPTITHLSLAHWPVPSLAPNSKTAAMNSRYGPPVQYGATNYYSHSLDDDWSEAAGILRRLSWSLYNLEWLNLDGCTEWSPALHWIESGINWREHWRKIRLISLKSSYELGGPERLTELIPLSGQLPLIEQDIVSYKEAVLRAVAVETHIRKERGWITVEHDDWERYDDFYWIRDSQAAAKVKIQNWDQRMNLARFSRHEDEKTSSTTRDSHSAFWH